VIDAVNLPDLWDEGQPGTLKEILVVDWEGLDEWKTTCTVAEWESIMVDVERDRCSSIKVWVEGDVRFESTFAEPE